MSTLKSRFPGSTGRLSRRNAPNPALRLLLAAVDALALITALFAALGWLDLAPEYLTALGVLMVASFLLNTVVLGSLEPLAPAAMVFYYLWIIGFGTSVAAWLDSETRSVTRVTDNEFYVTYLALSLVSVAAFNVGVSIRTQHLRGAHLSPAGESIEPSRAQHARQSRVANMGIGLIVLFAIYLLIAYASGNIPSTYTAFKDWSGTRLFNYLRYGFWFGAIFVGAAGIRRKATIGLLVGLIPGAILVMTGNRNDVLYPLLVGAGVYFFGRKERPWVLAVLLVVAILNFAPAISLSREGDIDAASGTSVRDRFLAALAEFGGQGRPVTEMFSWVNHGEGLALGGTYLVPTLVGLLGWVDPSLREWLVGSRFYLESRLPGLGFSMPGELYFNFGWLGVAVGYGLVGGALVTLEDRARTVDSRLIYGFTTLSLLHMQRNSFGLYGVVILLFGLTVMASRSVRILDSPGIGAISRDGWTKRFSKPNEDQSARR